jgi:UTP:GlnB (protein PII) uridylyltransferase
VLKRLTVRYPATVLALNRSKKLRILAKGRLADGERHSRSEDQKGFLGDFYDMDFLRIAMHTLRGASIEETCGDFAELTRTYFAGILDVCMREAEKEAGGRMPQRDRMAIFLTGGNARGRPYDEDFDLIVLVNSNDPQVIKIAERAVVRMNRQIARRGVIAQYRLGEHFGRFVSTVDEIAGLIKHSSPEYFVDCCQLIHSRLLVGAQRVERAMLGRLIRPIIFEQWKLFLSDVNAEITERRKDFKEMPENYLHIKEMPGGLREIDLCLAAAKAYNRVRETWATTVFDRLMKQDPDHSHEYDTLMRASEFLVALRSAYRVSVAASDVLERNWLSAPARIMGLEEKGGADPAGYLFDRICQTFEESEVAIDRIMADLNAAAES